MALTDNEIRIITLIDQRFWETGGLVSDDIICETLRVSPQIVKNAWKKQEFRQALVARGVDLDPNATNGLLTPTQVILANVLMNVHDKRSLREKLEMLNISTQQYQAWMRQPGFAQYLRTRAEKEFAATDYEAYLSLSELVKEGDFNGIKLFFEMRGIYNPKMQVEVNVDVVITQLIEIVAKHVEPSVLELIANDIERLELMPGSQNTPVERLEGAISI